MRDIEFRAWIMGNMWHDFAIYNGEIYVWNYEETKLVPAMTSDQKLAYDESVLMQFTGLLDKNGKKIFEGDIVKCYFWYKDIGIVKFGEFNISEEVYCGSGCSFSKDVVGWYAEQTPSENRNFCEQEELWGGDRFTVVGNIYENPELLKQGE